MKNRKRTMVAFALILVFVLAACTTPAPPGTSTPATAAPTAAPGPATAAPVAPSGDYNEAPMLAEMVARGELPPVDQRLPDEPFVSSAPEIGTYGGIYRGAGFGPTHGQLDTEAHRFVGLLRLEPDLQTTRPFLIKDWEVNANFTTYTLHLRSGLKWSDGELFTSADFTFWYDHILLNEEITPVIPGRYVVGGQTMQLTAPDELTVVITFASPNPAFDVVMLRSLFPGEAKWAPRHYLEPFHPDFNPDVDAQAATAGYDSWLEYFRFRFDRTQAGTDMEAPVIFPWALRSVDSDGNRYFDRNPYYFVVDTEGNQLPYIDQQVSVLVADNENRILRIMNGEIHAAAENPLPVRDFTLYVEGESRGNYTVFAFDNTRGSDAAVTFNINHPDLVLRELFNEVSFREAMALAIDRNMINDVLFFGRAAVRGGVPPPVPNTSFMEDWMISYMTEFDVDGANQRLDDLGLTRNAAGERMRPDGQPMFIVLESIEEFAPQAEMIAEMWTNNVGIRTEMKQQERAFMRERFATNERDAQIFTLDSVTEFAIRADPGRIRPPWPTHEIGFAPLYNEWYDTNGAEGLEPPQFVKDLRDKIDAWVTMEAGTPAFIAAGKEIAEIHTRNVWYIGTSVAPRVVIISNTLGNTPTEGTFAGDFGFWFPFRGDSWYFK